MLNMLSVSGSRPGFNAALQKVMENQGDIIRRVRYT